MKPSNSISTEGLSTIPLESTIGSGYITYLLNQITKLEVENSSINLEESNPDNQVLNKLLQSIAEGRNDKKTVDGVYLIESGGHFVMLNLQNLDGTIKYKVFDSLSHTPNGPRRFDLVTNILRNRFGADNVVPSENPYVGIQQGVDINAQDSDNCGLLCLFAQLIDDKGLTLGNLSSNGSQYHDLNKTLNSLRGQSIQSIDPNQLSQDLLGYFVQPSVPETEISESKKLKEVVSNIFKKYESSTGTNEAKPKQFSEVRAADLKRLENISRYIARITTKEEITEELLNNIGEETAKIVVNNSSKSNFIRNQYGLVGSKSDFTTRDGIEFMGLQSLRYIQASDLDPAKMDDLFCGLEITKQKIDFAIQEERDGSRYKSSVAQLRRDISNVDDLTKFSKFTREFYSQFLIEGITRELGLLKKIDSSQSLLQTNDKYFVSRTLAKIGERAKELLDHNDNDQLGQKTPLFKFLKDVRNKVSHTDPFIIIDREVSGEFLKDLIEAIDSGLSDGVDEEKQKKLDKIYESLKRPKSIKSAAVKIVEEDDSKQNDPYLITIKALTDKAKKYFELERDVADLLSLNLQKEKIDQSWKEDVLPLELERNQVYGVEVKQLESNLKELLKNHSELKTIDEKLASLPKKKSDAEKEIKTLEKKLKQHRENLAIAGKETLTNGEISRLQGIYKTYDISAIKSKIEEDIERTPNDIRKKKEDLEEINREEEVKNSDEYKELKRLQESIKQEKKKSRGAMSDLNARRSAIDEEMGVKMKDINNRIHEAEQKAEILSDTKNQIINLVQELEISVTDVDKILDENLFEEIEEVLIQDQSNRKNDKKEVDQKVAKKIVSKKLGTIEEQLKYVRSIYSDGFLEAEERSYILQHAFSIIGQYSRDIEDLEKNIVSEDSFKSLTKSSVTFRNSWRSNIKNRNKQIAHDIDSFDEDVFFRVVENDTLSIIEDISAISSIINFDYEQSKSQYANNMFDYTFGVVMNNIAFSHLRLGNYEQAESHFMEALTYFDQSRIIEEFKGNDPTIFENAPSGISKVSGSNPNLIVFLNLDKDFYSRKSHILGNLAELFVRMERWEEALSKFEEVEELEIQSNGSVSKGTLHNQATILHGLNRIDEAKSKVNLALKLPGEHESDAILLNDILFDECGEDIQEKRKKMEEMIKSCNNIRAKFSAISHAGGYDIKLGEFDRFESRINEMEEYIEVNESTLKSQMGNEFIKLQKEVLEARIALFTNKFHNEGDDIVTNADKLSENDITKVSKLPEVISKFNLDKTEFNQVSKKAMSNLASILSNISLVIREKSPEQSRSLLEKALEVQNINNFDSSKTLFQLGVIHYRLSKIGDKEENIKKSMESLVAAKNNSEDPKLSAFIQEQIGIISLERKDYRSALTSLLAAKKELSDDPDIENDIKSSMNGMIIYRQIEDKVIKSYQTQKKKGDNKTLNLGNIRKDDLEGYLKYELKVDTGVYQINGESKVKINEPLKAALEQKLAKNQEQSRR